MKRWICSAVIAGIGISAAVACSQQAVNVPVRTFERAQRVDVVCLRVLGPDPKHPGYQIPIPPVPSPQTACAPVPINVDGSLLPFHLFALVTQTTRGEVAVVDLTYGAVVDLDRSTPGINFLPVGAQPTDLAVTPDAQMTFVAASEVNKPAIYAIPSKDILGDSQGLPAAERPPAPSLPLWPVCALPQAPGSISVVPRTPTGVATPTADGGSTADGGPTTDGSYPYDVVVVLRGDARSSAKVVTLDPAPFFRGALLNGSIGPTIFPGALSPCVIKSAVELSGAIPEVVQAGPTWSDGVPYADPSAKADSVPTLGAATCGITPPILSDAGASDAGASDAGTGDAGTGEGGEAGAEVDGGQSFAFAEHLAPHAAAIARDGQILYVADDQVPVIHVIDLSESGVARELSPLLATSLNDPARKVAVGDLAVSPPTSNYQRFLYAIDKKEGSVMVFEVTDIVPGAVSSNPRVPLTRPHPELNPFQPPDRLTFAVPAAAVSFVRHDFGYAALNQNNVAAKSGLICNPNRNAGLDQGPFTGSDAALGAYYRANVTATNQNAPLGPFRLRGIFGFVTLTNGQVVAVDVDDWDAPCRRPDPMTLNPNITAYPTSSIAPPQPPAAAGDLNPYHVPVAFEREVPASSPVSLEAFFPVSAPHRTRSSFLLRNDPTSGNHVPALTGVPQLLNGSSILSGPTSPAFMLPTVSNLSDPTYTANPTEPDPEKRTTTYVTNPNDPDPARRNINGRNLSIPFSDSVPAVRFSWEEPQVHFDQDWTVTYEGLIPGFDGLATTAVSTQPKGDPNRYQTITLGNPEARFCRKGVEDFRLGTARATAELAAMAASGLTPTARLDHVTTDYVQLTDELLDVNDPYWGLEDTEDSCWGELEITTPNPSADDRARLAASRHDACLTNYGLVADNNVQRDFPILEAYDDRLIIGRYGYTGAPLTSSREVVDARTSSVAEKQNTAKFLQRMRCCFHRQVKFHVRAGAEWVTSGSSVGYLHHIAADAGGACVQSCDPRESLLNARAPTVPFPPAMADPVTLALPDRNSVLALRNPMFAFAMWGIPVQIRDSVWKFSTRGQFAPLAVNIGSGTTAVSPQSMRFIDSLGQLAVVDGSAQGLVLIDLNTVLRAHTPYF